MQNVEEQSSLSGSDFENIDGEYNSDFDMLDDALFEKRAQASKRRKFNFPEPMFPNIVNVGNLSRVTMLEQILEQLGVDEDDYLSWSS